MPSNPITPPSSPASEVSTPITAASCSASEVSSGQLEKCLIDCARSKVFLESASGFPMFNSFAAWIQFRDESIRFDSSIQAGRLHHIFSSFRSWRQCIVGLVVVSRHYSAAANLFLAKPLCPAWPIIPAFLSLRSGWPRFLSAIETQGNLWEDRRLCFLPFIKWQSSTRSSSLSKDFISARIVSTC